MSKKQKEQNYIQILCDYLNSGKPIKSSTGKELIIADDEVFLQCWDNTPRLQTFPKFWLISNHEHLVSVFNNKVKWIEGYQRDDGSRCYKYNEQIDDSIHVKSIETHNLMGLVFGSEVYGRAKELLDNDGVHAFGIKKKGVLKVNGHHKLGRNGEVTPKDIQFITTPVHIILGQIPTSDNLEQNLAFMHELSNLAQQEEPNKISIIFTGERYSLSTGERLPDDDYIAIHAVNSITFGGSRNE